MIALAANKKNGSSASKSSKSGSKKTVQYAERINGKTKCTIEISADAQKEDVLAQAKEALGAKLSGNIVKEIYVPGRIVNIVAK